MLDGSLCGIWWIWFGCLLDLACVFNCGLLVLLVGCCLGCYLGVWVLLCVVVICAVCGGCGQVVVDLLAWCCFVLAVGGCFCGYWFVGVFGCCLGIVLVGLILGLAIVCLWG